MIFLETVLRAGLATGGLVLPGAGWALARRWPLPWFTGGVASALAIFAGVVGFDLAGVSIKLATLGAWLAVAGLPGWWLWWRRRSVRDGAAGPEPAPVDWWIALPAVPLVAVAAWRAVVQPLWAADAVFRWNLLAEIVVRTGRLAGYPPVTVADFERYFWADGIAPLVSGCYAWTYLAAGSTAPVWTAIPVLLQTAGLLAVLRALGAEWGGMRGGWLACALGGATMLLQFSFNLGQETGCTALGAGGMVLCLLRWEKSGRTSVLVPAALCAALAACAREYGAIVPLAGALWIAARPSAFRPAVGFSTGACLLPAVWHAHVWAVTGNPLYAHALAGWFPTNPVFAAWMRHYAMLYRFDPAQASVWLELGRLLAVATLPALAGFLCGALVWRKQPGWWLVVGVAGVIAAAWVASVPLTAGGLFYSMRVLSPLLVLGCAWGGAALAGWLQSRRLLHGVVAGLTLVACDASLRALTIPSNPYTLSPGDWLEAGDRFRADFVRDDAPLIDRAVRTVSGRVLSDSAGLEGFFAKHGRRYSPLWSPDVAWLFGADDGRPAADRLRELGFSHLLLKRSEISVDFLAKAGVLRRLDGQLRPVMANDTFILMELVPANTVAAGKGDRE